MPGCDPAAPECNAPPQCGAFLPLVEIPQDAPAPLGGGIPDGLYVMIGYNRFTGPGGTSGPVPGYALRFTIAFQGGAAYTSSLEVMSGGPSTQSYGGSGAVVTLGLDVDLEPDCPAGESKTSLTHTLNGNVLHLYEQLPSSVSETVLEKQ